MTDLTDVIKVTLITGGVGGAKLAEGLAAILPPTQLSVIGNIGDDDEFHGLWVSPDIDTLTYTLAGSVDKENGWGIAGDSWQSLKALKQLGEDTWMQLGDRDLGTHIYRTMRRQQGAMPSDIAQEIAQSLGVEHPIILPTNQLLKTHIQTPAGRLSMQEYFVREQCQPAINAIDYTGCETATPNPAALNAIQQADLLIFAPSNPLLSIGPTLAILALRDAIADCQTYRIAISPLVGGQAIKGPTCAALQAGGYSADLWGIAAYYSGLIDGLVIDQQDRAQQPELAQLGLDIYHQNILMDDRDSRIAVARELLQNQCKNLQQTAGG